MADDVLRGLDGDRALPERARARLEELLTSRAWADDNPLTGIDGPRAVPVAARDRLEHLMAAGARESFAGLDEPRPMPADVRARLERALVRPVPVARRALVMRALAVAATVTMLASGTLAVVRFAGSEPDAPPLAGPSASPIPGAAVPDVASGLAPVSPREFPLLPAPVPVPGTVPAFADAGVGPAPPFAFPYESPEAAPPAGVSGGSGVAPAPIVEPAPAAPPLRIGIIRGDPEIEAGFRAYVGLLNRRGGVVGRQLRLVPVDAERGARGSVATVNLSASAISGADGPPAWTRGPVLETIAAGQDALAGPVYGFASPPARQAHLIADHVYPSAVSSPTTAVIYTAGPEPFNDDVPDAIAEVLDARGVAVVRMPWSPGAANLLFPADAAFLSMDTATSADWLQAARDNGYAPRAIAGIYPLFDASLLPLLRGLPVRILAPYALPLSDETRSRAFRRIEAPDGMDAVHGWVTAKDLAVAIWQNGALTPAAVRRALEGLDGYTSGFAPPLQTRRGTNARTPEGLVYAVADGVFTPRTPFLVDPF